MSCVLQLIVKMHAFCVQPFHHIVVAVSVVFHSAPVDCYTYAIPAVKHIFNTAGLRRHLWTICHVVSVSKDY